jgi:hypothetical protein
LALAAEVLSKEWGKARLPGPNDRVREGVTQAELGAQPPAHDLQNDSAGQRQAVERRARARVEDSRAAGAATGPLAELGATRVTVDVQWGQGISNPLLGTVEQVQGYQRISFAASPSTQS